MNERTEWPTQARMEALREQGMVPFSLFAARCFGALGIVGALLATRETWSGIIAGYTRALAGKPAELPVALAGLAIEAARVVALTVLAGAILSILAGLIQTRFAVRVPARAPRPRPGVMTATLSAILSILAAGLAVSVAAILSIPGFLSLLNARGGKIEMVGAERLAWILLAALLVGGAISMVLGRIRFMWEHRTTRKEAQQDLEGPA